jgi:hypothetical protein
VIRENQVSRSFDAARSQGQQGNMGGSPGGAKVSARVIKLCVLAEAFTQDADTVGRALQRQMGQTLRAVTVKQLADVRHRRI